MGFYPQAVDIDGDGLEDIVGGSYSGNIVYYKRTKDGFEPRKEIQQKTDLESKDYSEYIFTNCTFGDFNGDGLYDAFVGGNRGMRVMLNEGSKSEPIFGKRTPLMQTDGRAIVIFELSKSSRDFFIEHRGKGGDIGDYKSSAVFVDWDNDGVNDLIITTSYTNDKSSAILFCKGVKKGNEHIFEQGIPLIESLDGEKALPGTEFYHSVTDVNGDGILDILIGSSMCYDEKTNVIDKKVADNFHAPSKMGRIYIKGFVFVLYGGELYN